MQKKSNATFGNKKKETEKIFYSFINELYLLLNNSFDLYTALTIIKNSSQDKIQKQISTEIIKRIDKGQPFKEAVFNNIFSELPYFFKALFETAEKSNDVFNTIKNLKLYMEKKEKFEKNMKKNIFYPAITISLSFIVILSTLLFFIPSIFGIYNKIELHPPFLIKILFAFRYYFSAFIFITFFLFSVFFIKFIHNPYNLTLSFLKLIKFKKLEEWLNAYIFSFHIYILSNSGIHLQKSIKILSENHNLQYIKNTLNEIKNGGDFVKSLRKTAKLPDIFFEIIELATKTGNIKESFHYLFEYSENKLNDILNTILILAEPVIIIVSAGIVGIIIFACFYPLLTLSNVNLQL